MKPLMTAITVVLVVFGLGALYVGASSFGLLGRLWHDTNYHGLDHAIILFGTFGAIMWTIGMGVGSLVWAFIIGVTTWVS